MVGYKKIVLEIMALILIVTSCFTLRAQTQATYGQQIAVMKMLYPTLKSVGVLGGELSDKACQDITRMALAQGVQVALGRPKDVKEISQIYKKMVLEKNVQIIWIPDAGDDLLTGVGYEFLRTSALPEKIGLWVPDQKLLSTGAFCSVAVEDGKIVAYVSQKVAEILGQRIPADPTSSIKYVTK